MSDILENAFQKGRPRFPEWKLKAAATVHLAPPEACRRTKINAAYVITAFRTLHIEYGNKNHRRYAWLIQEFGEHFKRKQLIVAIGRVRNQAAARIFARELCRLKPTVRDGERLVRCWWDWFEGCIAMRIMRGQDIEIRTQFLIARRIVHGSSAPREKS
jgi:hypothetical protein